MSTILQMPARAHGGRQATITRVVLHATVSPCVTGGARANGRWFAGTQAGTSAHYVVDPQFIVQCLPDDVVGYHAPPNTGSIGVELCDPQTGPASRWDDPEHQLMLVRAAGLVADLCARHHLPVQHLDVAGLLAGRRGITRHVDVARAWGRSTHTDPGDGFPLDRFLELVRHAGGKPTPTPTPTTEDDDMKPDEREALFETRDLLRALVAPRRPDHQDVDPQHVSLGDVITADEQPPKQ